jgi:hypothetical protein
MMSMTPEEFAEEMSRIKSTTEFVHRDLHNAHMAADELMCKLLSALGYGAGVNAFCEMPKWYS